MRILRRNLRPIWYATYNDKSETVDEWGNNTGSWVVSYNPPVKAQWSVGFYKSDAESEEYGISLYDTIRIIAPLKDFPLDETSILWFGKEPKEPFDATNPDHNYVVEGILPGLNEVVVYARKV